MARRATLWHFSVSCASNLEELGGGGGREKEEVREECSKYFFKSVGSLRKKTALENAYKLSAD